MKIKLLSTLCIISLFLTACSNTTETSQADVPSKTSQTDNAPETSTSIQNEPTAETNSIPDSTSNDINDLESLGDISVEKELFSVTLTIPADYVGEVTQSDLDLSAKESGYKSITLNEDGSVTYVMTPSQHKELVDETRDNINESLAELIGSESYPNFTAVSANDDFTEFTITTKSAELDLNEAFSVIMFYMYGGMYHIFNGTQADNIHVDFINADTGEIISSSDSSEMK